MGFICHIHNYTEYNEEWNVFSAFNTSKCTHLEQWAADCATPGEQSWTSCRSRDSFRTHNLGLSWVKSPTLYPLGHDCDIVRGGYHPPPMCSIDATAAILHQNALHTPAYWWRGDSDEANQCIEMIRRP